MGKHRANPQNNRDLSSHVVTDKDFLQFKSLLKRLNKKYKISSTELVSLAQKEILVPVSIFIPQLTPLEAYVKYLKENLDNDYSAIAKITGRSRKSVWQAYKTASMNYSDKIVPADSQYNMPSTILSGELSVFEAVVAHLKEHFELSYHQIGELVQRDERTIWTVYHRAEMKSKRKNEVSR